MQNTFSIRICDKNPHRWYVSFSLSKPFSMKNIKEILEQENYSTLAVTPNIMVFRGKDVKITWHFQGLVQIDYYDRIIQNEGSVTMFVHDLIDKFDFL